MKYSQTIDNVCEVKMSDEGTVLNDLTNEVSLAILFSPYVQPLINKIRALMIERDQLKAERDQLRTELAVAYSKPFSVEEVRVLMTELARYKTSLEVAEEWARGVAE